MQFGPRKQYILDNKECRRFCTLRNIPKWHFGWGEAYFGNIVYMLLFFYLDNLRPNFKDIVALKMLIPTVFFMLTLLLWCTNYS